MSHFPKIDGYDLVAGPSIEIRHKLHWLSFCDPERPAGTQFLGAIVLECFEDPGLAASECWALGINPGGEMLMIDVPEEKVAWVREKYPLGKLLSTEDIERIAGVAPRRVSAEELGAECEACKSEDSE